jgi:RNA polymerase sigma-70 factor (ECF subfamily)
MGEADVGRIFREELGRSVAALLRTFGDLDVAEDAVRFEGRGSLRSPRRGGLRHRGGR